MMLHANVKQSILENLRTGMSLRRVADLVGYSITEIGVAMKNDSVFATEVRQAQAIPELQLLMKLQASPQWLAWKFLLQSLYPTRYVSSRKKPGALKPPQLESEKTRLARLTAQELAVLEPLIEKMDGIPIDGPDPETRSDPHRPHGERTN